MTKKLFLISTLAVGLLAGCEKEEPVGHPVESDILVATRIDNGEVLIDAETEMVYPVSRYTIAFTRDRSFKTIKIKFTEILMTGYMQRPGPAGTWVNLGMLDKGEYTVKFYSMGKTTKATLTVKDTTAALKIKDPGNVRLR